MFSSSEQHLSPQMVSQLFTISFFSFTVHYSFFIGKFVFVINILAGTGEFDVRERDLVIVSGFIKVQTTNELMELSELKSYDVDQLSSADVYQDLACKGYKYGKSFRGINLTSNNGISSDYCLFVEFN